MGRRPLPPPPPTAPASDPWPGVGAPVVGASAARPPRSPVPGGLSSTFSPSRWADGDCGGRGPPQAARRASGQDPWGGGPRGWTSAPPPSRLSGSLWAGAGGAPPPPVSELPLAAKARRGTAASAAAARALAARATHAAATVTAAVQSAGGAVSAARGRGVAAAVRGARRLARRFAAAAGRATEAAVAGHAALAAVASAAALPVPARADAVWLIALAVLTVVAVGSAAVDRSAAAADAWVLSDAVAVTGRLPPRPLLPPLPGGGGSRRVIPAVLAAVTAAAASTDEAVAAAAAAAAPPGEDEDEEEERAQWAPGGARYPRRFPPGMDDSSRGEWAALGLAFPHPLSIVAERAAMAGAIVGQLPPLGAYVGTSPAAVAAEVRRLTLPPPGYANRRRGVFRDRYPATAPAAEAPPGGTAAFDEVFVLVPSDCNGRWEAWRAAAAARGIHRVTRVPIGGSGGPGALPVRTDAAALAAAAIPAEGAAASFLTGSAVWHAGAGHGEGWLNAAVRWALGSTARPPIPPPMPPPPPPFPSPDMATAARILGAFPRDARRLDVASVKDLERHAALAAAHDAVWRAAAARNRTRVLVLDADLVPSAGVLAGLPALMNEVDAASVDAARAWHVLCLRCVRVGDGGTAAAAVAVPWAVAGGLTISAGGGLPVGAGAYALSAAGVAALTRPPAGYGAPADAGWAVTAAASGGAFVALHLAEVGRGVGGVQALPDPAGGVQGGEGCAWRRAAEADVAARLGGTGPFHISS